MINTPFVFSTRSLYRNEVTFIDFSLFRSRKIGVCIIDSIPHCPTENAMKRDKNQEMWLRFLYRGRLIFKPLGQCGILSMINTPFVFSTRSLYRNEATFLDFCLFTCF